MVRKSVSPWQEEALLCQKVMMVPRKLDFPPPLQQGRKERSKAMHRKVPSKTSQRKRLQGDLFVFALFAHFAFPSFWRRQRCFLSSSYLFLSSFCVSHRIMVCLVVYTSYTHYAATSRSFFLYLSEDSLSSGVTSSRFRTLFQKTVFLDSIWYGILSLFFFLVGILPWTFDLFMTNWSPLMFAADFSWHVTSLCFQSSVMKAPHSAPFPPNTIGAVHVEIMFSSSIKCE